MTCSRWNNERDMLIAKTGNDLQLVTIVRKMCEDRDAWKAFRNFAESTLSIKEEDERQRQRRRVLTSEDDDD